jgi:hypothetical protein
MLYLLTLWIVIQHHKWLIDYNEGLCLFQQQKQQQILDSEADDQELLTFSNSTACSLILTKASLLAGAKLVTHGEMQVLIFFARYGVKNLNVCFAVTILYYFMIDFFCLTHNSVYVVHWDQQKLLHGVSW